MEIECLKRAQASSSDWMLYKRGMATAFICHGFFTRAKSLKTQSWLHNLKGLVLDKLLQVSTFKSASLKRGQQEETAEEGHLSMLLKQGYRPRIENSGLII